MLLKNMATERMMKVPTMTDLNVRIVIIGSEARRVVRLARHGRGHAVSKSSFCIRYATAEAFLERQ